VAGLWPDGKFTSCLILGNEMMVRKFLLWLALFLAFGIGDHPVHGGTFGGEEKHSSRERLYNMARSGKSKTGQARAVLRSCIEDWSRSIAG
jgi:hypothetical protein